MVTKEKTTLDNKFSILIIIIITLLLLAVVVIFNNTQPVEDVLDEQVPNQIITEPEINDIVDEIIPSYDSAVETQSVRISAGHFNPEEILINVGDIVTWRNDDSITHTITSNTFSSNNLGKSVLYTYTFNVPGVYEYHCKYHPNETGKVIVR
jgi:plastocyanin